MMIRSLFLLAGCIACLLVTGSHAFLPSSLSSKTTFQRASFLPAAPQQPTDHDHDDDEEQTNRQQHTPDQQSLSRRNMLGSLATTTTTALALSFLSMNPAFAQDDAVGVATPVKAKVLVLGGTGFVGSRVVQTLRDLGIPTIATSRDGRDGTTALDFTFASDKDVQQKVQTLAAGCTAVISCVGTIGTEFDEQVNSATALAAAGAKAAGVQRFVYITVAPEVKEFAKDIDFLAGYMRGKTVSRDAVLANFPDSSTLIEPTFIYGGGSFEINPPRVAGFYGKIIEGLLSSSPIRAVTGIAPAGIIKIALEPPVPVEAVASAAVAGALGKKGAPAILDTYDEIKQAASLI
jgi:uncharacterized protein YbjT (DUF2867 family)